MDVGRRYSVSVELVQRGKLSTQLPVERIQRHTNPDEDVGMRQSFERLVAEKHRIRQAAFKGRQTFGDAAEFLSDAFGELLFALKLRYQFQLAFKSE